MDSQGKPWLSSLFTYFLHILFAQPVHPHWGISQPSLMRLTADLNIARIKRFFMKIIFIQFLIYFLQSDYFLILFGV